MVVFLFVSSTSTQTTYALMEHPDSSLHCPCQSRNHFAGGSAALGRVSIFPTSWDFCPRQYLFGDNLALNQLNQTNQGPYARVQGRRATSKVTATSGGRLTNRYAWVPGRPTRRACLGVNLPLRVPPCKHYPEDVTELKMAALILLRYRQRRLLRRNRIFRDRTNPLHKFNDLELFWQFRFRRVDILQMTNELKEELEHLNRKGTLPPVFTGRR